MKNFFKTVIILILIFLLFSCGKAEEPKEKLLDAPNNFSIKLVWGTYGQSYYSSKSGRLVKTTNSNNINKFVTEYHLSEEELNYIYTKIIDLDLISYPNNYKIETEISKTPPNECEFSFSYGHYQSKTIKIDNTLPLELLDYEGDEFIGLIKDIIHTLTESEQWKSLPDYDFRYM